MASRTYICLHYLSCEVTSLILSNSFRFSTSSCRASIILSLSADSLCRASISLSASTQRASVSANRFLSKGGEEEAKVGNGSVNGREIGIA